MCNLSLAEAPNIEVVLRIRELGSSLGPETVYLNRGLPCFSYQHSVLKWATSTPLPLLLSNQYTPTVNYCFRDRPKIIETRAERCLLCISNLTVLHFVYRRQKPTAANLIALTEQTMSLLSFCYITNMSNAPNSSCRFLQTLYFIPCAYLFFLEK